MRTFFTTRSGFGSRSMPYSGAVPCEPENVLSSMTTPSAPTTDSPCRRLP